MGVEVAVEGLTKSFGSQKIWQDVSLTLPAGEVSALLGPSGTGKSVFLKSLIGLLRPEEGSIVIDGTDILQCSSRELYEIRKLFGVLFQDGALFGSMNLYDNVAFPLREHTKKSESEIRKIVMEKLELNGLVGAEGKLPGEISGGMRKRAGLARALVLDPQIILVDEPDSGLDPVRTTYLSQLLIDINAQIDATILIVTHNINLARTVPDNLGMLFRKQLVMFGLARCCSPVTSRWSTSSSTAARSARSACPRRRTRRRWRTSRPSSTPVITTAAPTTSTVWCRRCRQRPGSPCARLSPAVRPASVRSSIPCRSRPSRASLQA